MDKLCYVSAFFDIGRDEWQNRFKRNFAEYLTAFTPYITLFKNNPDSNCEMIVYIDEKYYQQLRDIIDWKLPIRLFKTTDAFLLENTMWCRLDREKAIMESDEYKGLIPNRLHFPESNNPKYTLINHIKVDFVAHATTLSDSAYYCWVDFGYFQLQKNIPSKMLDISKLDRERINYTLINPLTSLDSNILYTLQAAPEKIGGFFFFGSRQNMLKYQNLYREIHANFQQLNLADDDQHLALRCYYTQPDLFCLHMLGGWHLALTHFQSN